MHTERRSSRDCQ